MSGTGGLSAILLEAPRNCWLALNEEQTAVVGAGRTIEEAIEKAKAKGVEDPIIIWAPKEWIPSIF